VTRRTSSRCIDRRLHLKGRAEGMRVRQRPGTGHAEAVPKPGLPSLAPAMPQPRQGPAKHGAREQGPLSPRTEVSARLGQSSTRCQCPGTALLRRSEAAGATVLGRGWHPLFSRARQRLPQRGPRPAPSLQAAAGPAHSSASPPRPAWGLTAPSPP